MILALCKTKFLSERLQLALLDTKKTAQFFTSFALFKEKIKITKMDKTVILIIDMDHPSKDKINALIDFFGKKFNVNIYVPPIILIAKSFKKNEETLRLPPYASAILQKPINPLLFNKVLRNIEFCQKYWPNNGCRFSAVISLRKLECDSFDGDPSFLALVHPNLRKIYSSKKFNFHFGKLKDDELVTDLMLSAFDYEGDADRKILIKINNSGKEIIYGTEVLNRQWPLLTLNVLDPKSEYTFTTSDKIKNIIQNQYVYKYTRIRYYQYKKIGNHNKIYLAAWKGPLSSNINNLAEHQRWYKYDNLEEKIKKQFKNLPFFSRIKDIEENIFWLTNIEIKQSDLSAYYVPIVDNNTLIGLLAFDNCNDTTEWLTDSLSEAPSNISLTKESQAPKINEIKKISRWIIDSERKDFERLSLDIHTRSAKHKSSYWLSLLDTSYDEDKTLAKLLDTCIEVTGASGGAFWRFTDKGESLIRVGKRRPVYEHLQKIEWKHKDSMHPASRAVSDKKPKYFGQLDGKCSDGSERNEIENYFSGLDQFKKNETPHFKSIGGFPQLFPDSHD